MPTNRDVVPNGGRYVLAWAVAFLFGLAGAVLAMALFWFVLF